MGEDGKIVGFAPALFPVSSLPSSSSTATPTLFHSFASAPSVALESNSRVPSLFPIRLGETSGPPEDDDGAQNGEGGQDFVYYAVAPGSQVPAVESRDRDSSEARKRRKEKKRKRRIEEESTRTGKNERKQLKSDADGRKIGVLDRETEERKSAASALIDGNANSRKEFYFDSRGDRDNLAYGSLYRKDIARYRREEIQQLRGEKPGGISGQRQRLFEIEGNSAVDKAASRYWSSKFTSLVRKRKLKQFRAGSDKIARNLNDGKLAQLGDFVPLEIGKDELYDSQVDDMEEGATWHENVTQRTREFNTITREKPHDESSWIRFADFQEELIQATTKKSIAQQLVEKKIAILEKALGENKDSEDLLILYLETCQRRDDADTLLSKWEHAVRGHPGSFRMWQEFLRFRLAQFSTFSVSSLRTLYNRALQTLTLARNRISQKELKRDDYGEDFVDAEQALVSIFVNLCRFNWQAGHHELAVGLMQAEIEYSLFSPQMELSEADKQTLFENFWRSGAQRFGEDGALGWVMWFNEEQQLQQELKARETRLLEEAQLEEEAGGWTGWSNPKKEVNDFHNEAGLVDEVLYAEEEEEEAGVDDEISPMEEDDVALQEKLGLSFDPSKEVEVNDTQIWRRWSEKEVERDREQWAPLHEQNGVDEDELERMVLFEDIKDSLFSLHTKQAQLSLLYQFIDFCDGLLSQWCSTNKRSYMSMLESLESLKGTMLAATMSCAKLHEENVTENSIAKLMKSPSWYQESDGRAKFLRNCASLGRYVFPQERPVLDALLNAEDLASDNRKTKGLKMLPSQALCKRLLKTHRKDLLIWAAYACSEAAAGNIVAARKVFDTALASLGALSTEVVPDAPILCLAYAEVELAQVSSEPDITVEQRALYILCCLGTGCVYVALSSSNGFPTTLLIKAQRGFRDHLQRVRTIEGRKDLTERGAALITCAAMFEHLMSGWEAAAAVFEEGLAMSLPRKRRQSLECEVLTLRYIRMLENTKTTANPARLWSTMLRWFGQYPFNATLMASCVRSASQFARGYKLRRFFDDATANYASPTLWLLSLSSEMGRPGAGPRIHRQFERALEHKETRHSVLLWRCYLAYEVHIASNLDAARRVYFRAIHACPWSKILWVDGFLMLSSILSAKELSEFVDVMRDKGLRLRTDIYEILLEDEDEGGLL